jgi:hypothetical protein
MVRYAFEDTHLKPNLITRLANLFLGPSPSTITVDYILENVELWFVTSERVLRISNLGVINETLAPQWLMRSTQHRPAELHATEQAASPLKATMRSLGSSLITAFPWRLQSSNQSPRPA